VIERQFLRAVAFALAGAVLTFFGFMHGEQIGLVQSSAVALSYLLVSGVLASCIRRATRCPNLATSTRRGAR
jgi:AGZA family xanthine/uracil permease-like MFS transporter